MPTSVPPSAPKTKAPNEEGRAVGLSGLVALSCWQPWATFMCAPDPAQRDGSPAKAWETRSWYPRVLPEALAIHATLGIGADERRAISTGQRFREPYASTLVRLGYAPLDPWAPEYAARVARYNHDHGRELGSEYAALPLGAIVGVCEVAQVYRAEAAAEIIGRSGRLMEIALGDYAMGRFAWQLRAMRLVPVPVACAGAQQLWSVPAEVAAQVRAQLEAADVRDC